MNEKQTCPDCGTGLGQPHVNQCDVERCSQCGGQRISCDCEDHTPSESVWTGVWPEAASVKEEAFDEAKARFDQMIGMESTAGDRDGFLYRSPTGFPLAEMFLCEDCNGKLGPFFGQPVALQKDWVKEQQS